MRARAIGEPDAGQTREGAPRALGGRDAAIEQRQFHVLHGARAGEEVEVLEHETDAAVANRGERIAGKARNLLAGKKVLARARAVEAAEQVHERRFAGSGRAHDRNELARLDRQRHPAQGVNIIRVEPVHLREMTRDDKGRAHASGNSAALKSRSAGRRLARGSSALLPCR